ncbi:DUF4167 domain-containing protein [Hyphobacterium sp.]|uniref:DUF4167 domain-containing protein n=1 Tax=Hyphobacterium sp. TaxID=2004662 RepID=UPI003BA98A69
MKRQRGRGRGKPGGNQGNRSFESNGPDVKIRGNASTIYDKYMQLARDASSSGDRVMAENYFQHADHYFRIVSVQQAEQEQRRQARQQQQEDQNRRQQNRQQGGDEDNAPDNAEDKRDQSGDANEHERPRRGRRPKRQPAEDKRDPLEVVDPEKGGQSEMASDENADDQPRPRRGRRPRKPTDEGSGGSETEAA